VYGGSLALRPGKLVTAIGAACVAGGDDRQAFGTFLCQRLAVAIAAAFLDRDFAGAEAAIKTVFLAQHAHDVLAVSA
jgi:hypothetical protein